VIDFLGELSTVAARTRLAALYEEYAADRVAGGAAQRAALARWCRASRRPVADAARLSEGALAREAADRGHDMVHAEYLWAVAEQPASFAASRDHVRRLIAHRATRKPPSMLDPVTGGVWLWQQPFDDAFCALFAKLTGPQVIELLDPRSGWEPIAQFDGRWEAWAFVIACLDADARPWPADVVDAIASVIPTDPELSGAAWDALARHGGDAVRAMLRRTLAVGDPARWPLYGLAGDEESVAWLVENAAGDKNLDRLVAAIMRLDDPGRSELFGRLCDRFPPGPVRQFVLELVETYATDPPARIAQASEHATSVLSGGSANSEQLARATRYLGAADPEALTAALTDGATAESFREALSRRMNGEFAIEAIHWTFVVQGINPDPASPLPPILAAITGDRSVVTTIGLERVGHAARPRFAAAGQIIEAPLLDLIVEREPDLAAAAIAARLASPVRVEGADGLVAAEANVRGYHLWLLASCAARSDVVASAVILDGRLLSDAASANPALARGAAAALLAAANR
jgi:hypothetical protein